MTFELVAISYWKFISKTNKITLIYFKFYQPYDEHLKFFFDLFTDFYKCAIRFIIIMTVDK